MSNLSGYDSEVVGFDCVSQDSRPKTSSSSQTTEFQELGTGSQTNVSKSIGCSVNHDDLSNLSHEQEGLKEYPPGLNEFLRKAAPIMMEQLEQNYKESLNCSSDSDDEEMLTAKLLQEIKVNDGSGDHGSSILGVSWSSAGNSLAVSIGQKVHETWCQGSGLMKVYSLRSGDRFLHAMDVTEKSCVSVLKYHPTLAGMLAYGTASGEVVLCDLRDGGVGAGAQLASPAGCHGSRRVSALQWADAALANTFLMMQITSKGRRRGASDQVLFSAGSDGTLNVWQVNANQKVFENILFYTIARAQRLLTDISAFDFIKNSPLRPATEKTPNDVFVVGTTAGKLLLCRIKSPEPGDVLDPVYEALEGHSTCVLDVAFYSQRPGVFVSVSMDSEMRIYDINQGTPLKVVFLDAPVSCLCWLSPAPCLAAGLAARGELLRVYSASSGRALPVAGLAGAGSTTCVAVTHGGSCRIAAGDDSGTVRVWELPARRIKLSASDLDF